MKLRKEFLKMTHKKRIKGFLNGLTLKQVLGFVAVLLLIDIYLQVLNLMKPNVISTEDILGLSLDMSPRLEEVMNKNIDFIQEEPKSSPQTCKQKPPLKVVVITTLIVSLVVYGICHHYGVCPETIGDWFNRLNEHVIDPAIASSAPIVDYSTSDRSFFAEDYLPQTTEVQVPTTFVYTPIGGPMGISRELP